MRRLSIAASVLPLFLLAACGGGGNPPVPAPSSEPVAAARAAQPVAAGDEALAPLFGSWGLDPAACTQTLEISKTRFEGAENGCDIAGYTDNGDGSYTASLTCGTTQEQIRMRPVFAPTGEGIELTYLNRNNQETLVLRCAEAEAAN
jgi:hypothetical protein